MPVGRGTRTGTWTLRDNRQQGGMSTRATRMIIKTTRIRRTRVRTTKKTKLRDNKEDDDYNDDAG